MSPLLYVLVILLLVGALPHVSWHWNGYGYTPAGMGVACIVGLLVLAFLGRLPR